MTDIALAARAAIQRAYRGVRADYPCLIWVADFLLDVTGRDFAADWRHVRWNERQTVRHLRLLAIGGSGACLVERALDGVAMRHSWPERDGGRQGAVMVGVYPALARFGSPAIFDGQRRWIAADDTAGALSIGAQPARMWEVTGC